MASTIRIMPVLEFPFLTASSIHHPKRPSVKRRFKYWVSRTVVNKPDQEALSHDEKGLSIINTVGL